MKKRVILPLLLVFSMAASLAAQCIGGVCPPTRPATSQPRPCKTRCLIVTLVPTVRL